MAFVDSFSIASSATESTAVATKEEILVDLENLLVPEIVFVQDICAENLRCYTACQILETFTRKATFNCCEVLCCCY